MSPPSPPDLHALPGFRARHDPDQAALDASRAVVALFLAARSTELTVRALAEHTGLSERTFYRYFPRKEDAVRPYLEAGLAHVLAALDGAPAELPLREALVAAHAELLDHAGGEASAALLALVAGSERLRALWLSLLVDAEVGFAAVIGRRLGLPGDGLRARLLAAVVVAAGRLALSPPPDDHRDRSLIFAEALDLLGADLWARPDAPAQHL